MAGVLDLGGPLGPCRGLDGVIMIHLWLDDWMVFVRHYTGHHMQRSVPVTFWELMPGDVVPSLLDPPSYPNQKLWSAFTYSNGAGHQPSAAGHRFGGWAEATGFLSLLSQQRQAACTHHQVIGAWGSWLQISGQISESKLRWNLYVPHLETVIIQIQVNLNRAS